MRTLLCLFLLCSFAAAETLNVKVIDHHVGEDGDIKPASAPNASAGCGAYGNAAICSSSSSDDSLYAPTHDLQPSPTDIVITLLLPDGRKVVVGCEDRLQALAKHHRHSCKNPMGNDIVANFSGSKAKLTWPVGFNSKKKESETFIIVQVISPSAAKALAPSPGPSPASATPVRDAYLASPSSPYN